MQYIKQIDSRYKKYGLQTKIIHPPEWEFEKDRKNIEQFFKKHNIKFSLTLDKKRKIINGLGINFWPSQILLEQGKVIYIHTGEGKYKDLEEKIIENLNIKDVVLKKLFNSEPKYSKYPTIYCGKRKRGKVVLLKNKLRFGTLYASKNWSQENEYLRSKENNCSLAISTKGKIVNFVAESLTTKPISVLVKLNNEVVSNLLITKPRLYNIFQASKDKKQELTLTTEKDLAIYSFSFQ